MSRRAVFLDRDGTLVVEKNYLSLPDQLEFYPGSVPGLRLLARTDLALILVSNQSGVGRGYFTEADVAAVHVRLTDMLAAEGLALDALYYCPHHPEAKLAEYRVRCDCRKPGPGMPLLAARENDLELTGSWVIGDKEEDIELGAALGLRPILVSTGLGADTANTPSARFAETVVDDLLAAAQWILDREGAL